MADYKNGEHLKLQIPGPRGKKVVGRNVTRHLCDFCELLKKSLKCVEKILKAKFQNPTTKIQNDAVKLTTEVLRIFITEGAARSAIQAQSESTDEITTPEVTNQHLEKILPQLLLDF